MQMQPRCLGSWQVPKPCASWPVPLHSCSEQGLIMPQKPGVEESARQLQPWKLSWQVP